MDADNLVLNLGGDAQIDKSFVNRATDPVISPTYATPGDFAAQYPTPLDPTEIVAMCEEITLWEYLPELTTGLKYDFWRELNELAFTSGSSYISFADGACPEEYSHDGDNTTVTLKNIGAKKSLGISDIIHSRSVASGYGDAINRLTAGAPAGEGMPGGSNMPSMSPTEMVMDLKAKEARLGMTLVLNGWDRLLVEGNKVSNSLEFDGIENWQANNAVSFHDNNNGTTGSFTTGTFSAATFDRWLSESCAKPTVLMGHPQAIQEMMSAYFQLGFQGSQVVNFQDGNRITPGFNFASYVNTGVGRLQVVADNNFNRTTVGSTIQSDIWAFRMTHNGVPLVYKRTQIPLSMNDLVPGCTAIAFQIWAKTALVIKHACAHGQYKAWFTGKVATTCAVIG